MKKTSDPSPLAILFGGEPATVRFVDGTAHQVFVRALPERYLLGVFLQHMEQGADTIELCTYLPARARLAGAPAHPEIPEPQGYAAVPAHWSENLDDASHDKLYELAKKLNFHRAEKLARGRLSAKQQVAPLNQKIWAQMMPIVSETVKSLLKASSSSTPSVPSSSAAPATSS